GLRRIGALPLFSQRGESFLYDSGMLALGILLTRATGRSSLGDVLRERVFEPLGMLDTAFHVPPQKVDRLPAQYAADPATGAPTIHDPAGAGSIFARPPPLESGSGGLVSTADDYLALCRMLLAKGRHQDGRLLSRPSVELMTTDQLTPHQRAEARVFFGDNRSWGLGIAVNVRR